MKNYKRLGDHIKGMEVSLSGKFRYVVYNNSPLKIYYMSHAAMAANSTSSLTSLSFNLLFGFMPDTQINRSSR